MRRGAGVGIVAALVLCMSAGGQVELRSGERLEGEVEDATIAALKLAPESSGGPARLVSWDRVKRVEGEGASKAKTYEPVMDQLWRARTRVERGDFAAAEPLLEKLREMYGAEEGPSAAVVAECTIRCYLAREARGAAASAWLWLTSLTEKKSGSGGAKVQWVGGTTNLPAITDPGTHLAPAIPPIWTPGAATRAAATATDWAALKARGGVAGELASLYEKAARFEAGIDAEVVIGPQTHADPAVSIVREIVMARAGDAAARETARKAIQTRLSLGAARVEGGRMRSAQTPSWLEAWLRMGLGMSMIREEDSSTRMRGVIELLHVPARFQSEQPNLAGIALAEAAVVMADEGDTGAAVALKQELQSRYAGHPVLAWEALNRITVPAPAQPGPGRGGPARTYSYDAGRERATMPIVAADGRMYTRSRRIRRAAASRGLA